MRESKRKKRRNRWKLKQQLRFLDCLVLNKLKSSYERSMASWGGTRCPGCGIPIRPAYLAGTDYSGFIYSQDKRVGHITAFGYACDSKYFKRKCPGINEDWMDKYMNS